MPKKTQKGKKRNVKKKECLKKKGKFFFFCRNSQMCSNNPEYELSEEQRMAAENIVNYLFKKEPQNCSTYIIPFKYVRITNKKIPFIFYNPLLTFE